MENNTFKFLKNITLLYAEDDLLVQKQMHTILEKFVKKIYLANNGREAAKIFNEEQIDIVVTDITMPNIDGIELSKIIRKENKEIPIIITSAHNNSDYFIKAIEIGISRFILKPIVVSELVDVLGEFAQTISVKEENRNILNIFEQYKTIVDESSIVTKTDLDGIITYVNQPFVDISGYSRDELIGANHNIIRHPDTPKEVFRKLWDTIEKKEVWHGIVKNKTKQGKEYYVQSTIMPLLDVNGEIVEYIAIRQDITTLEKTKQFLQKQNFKKISNLNDAIKNQEQYEQIIDEINIVSRVDTNGKITYVNDKFCELSGYKREELIGKTYELVKHELMDKQLSKKIWKIVTNGKPWIGQLINRAKQGKTFHLNAVIAPIFNVDNEIIEYISICHNITPIIELHEELEDTQREIIYRMGEIGETRSKETGNHVKRVAEYSKLLGKLCGLEQKQIDNLFMASPIHDIGKVGIPDEILNKPGKLNPQEWEIMKEHSELGYKILKNSKREILKAAAIISLHHHEKWNGKGYPNALRGEDIHIFGRITAIADVFDALGSNRCYKKAWELEKILKLFKEQRGKHFDPNLIDLFFENLEEFLVIRDKYVD